MPSIFNGESPQTQPQQDAPSATAHPSPVLWGPVACIALAAGLTLCGAAALMIDLPIARWCLEGKCPGEVWRLFSLTETFAHGTGVVLILITLSLLDPASRRYVPRLAAASLGAGLIANIGKLCITRMRPQYHDFQGGVLDTFTAWLPLFQGKSEGQSFPSAHTATAFGFALALTWIYSRGGWWFLTLAVLSGCQRVAGGAHFASDTLWGGAIGCVTATACLYWPVVARHFERLESHAEVDASGDNISEPLEQPSTLRWERRRSDRAA